MRADDPEKARAVDEAIRQIPNGAGNPVRVDVPDAPTDREYRAIVPADAGAPVVFYRSLAANPDGGWLVTALMDQDKYEDYRRAERSGLLDTPLVREAASAAATAAGGTVSSLNDSAPGRTSGDGPETGRTG
jgi:hypothetical protein